MLTFFEPFMVINVENCDFHPPVPDELKPSNGSKQTVLTLVNSNSKNWFLKSFL